MACSRFSGKTGEVGDGRSVGTKSSGEDGAWHGEKTKNRRKRPTFFQVKFSGDIVIHMYKILAKFRDTQDFAMSFQHRVASGSIS